jgi:hypothetical protein
MSNSLPSWPGWVIDQPQYNPDEIRIQKALEKFDFSDISDAEKDLALKNIAKYPQEQEWFMIDLEKIGTNTPINETEKNFIRNKYLKGFWQVVDTPYGKLSFAEIQKHEKKDEILDDIMTPEQQREYSNWKKWVKEVANQRIEAKKQVEQVANQTEKKLDTNIQVANQRIESKWAELIEKKEKLKIQITELQSIKWVPKPNIEEVRKEALQRPPELQWKILTKKEIESPDFDIILLANYYVSNAGDIGRSMTNDSDRALFEKSISWIKRTLSGDKSPEDLYKITDRVVLWSARDQINARWEKIIESKNIKDITWNPDTREIIMKWDTETYILETSSVPPRERMVRGAIVISREVPEITWAEKSLKKKEWEKRNWENELLEKKKNFEFADLSKIPEDFPSQWALEEYKRAKEAFNTAKNPESILTNISWLKSANETLDQQFRNRREESIKIGKNSTPYEELSHELWKEKQHISWLMISLQNTMQLDREAMSLKWKLPEDAVDTFESNAKHNMEALSRLGIAKSCRTMDEVCGFLATQWWADTSSDWWDKESVNAFLWREKLKSTQLEKLLGSLVKIHDTIRQDKVGELADNSAKVAVLNRDEWDGTIKLEKSLDIYRKRNEWKLLSQSDFQRLLSEKTKTQ